MSDTEVRDAVLRFFAEHAHEPLPGDDPAEQLRIAYLDEGLVDSIAIVELVVELEASYGIRFAPADLQSAEFRTIGGLVRTVERLRAAA
jgi:acyl carrier protein